MKHEALNPESRAVKLWKPDMMFTVIAGLMIAFELFAIGVLLYLGTFNRYLADDYCEMVIMGNGPALPAVIKIYFGGDFRGTYRYSKFLLIGLAESFGTHNVQFLPILLILIWLIGLVWSVNQLRKLMGIRLPMIFDYWMAISVVFFSMWQAPNRFQTFFWRSSMTAHFAPLVFLPLLSGFVLHQINTGKKPGLWTLIFVMLASFLVGGFSEPPTATVIVAIIMLILLASKWKDDTRRRSSLNLLIYSLVGFSLAFIAIFLSPGNVSHGKTSLAELLVTFEKTIRYTFDFLGDTVRTLPLPSFISILSSFVMFFVFSISSETQPLVHINRRQVWISLGVVALIQIILIAASFAPSAYGQSYPSERARFLGRLIMTVAFLLEGALLGVLCSDLAAKSWRQVLLPLGALVFFILALYPLRAGMSLLDTFPDYRKWASTWDLRETEIHRSIALGEKDLVVRWLPTKEGIKEIDGSTRHWVNQCAASYYGVNTIRSVPMSDD